MKISYFFIIPILFCASGIFAQNLFNDRSDLLGKRDMHSAVPVAIADMNGDGLDDIITLNAGTSLIIQYQTPDPDRPFARLEIPVGIDVSEQNDICIADFNNDGANDIFIVGSYDRIKVLYSIPNTYAYNLTYVVVTPFFSQGASSGDFNGDGWVDVVILNDNAANYTLLNDGTGNLVEQPLFNFVTDPPSDNSGNYGSLFTDFDMDGDLDLYIAKCRQGVTNPTDPRRIDILFVNDGNGNYTQSAAKYGLADGHQTWTADFGDIDNDGDLDLFKTEHDVICALFKNINNDTFVDVTPTCGLNIGGVPLQGMIRDFDNDGWQDILVSGDITELWHNDGDGTFTKLPQFGNTIFGTFALGDLNDDGFTDVYASSVMPFNSVDLLNEDRLYLGVKNANHYLSLELHNTPLNTSAIGAMALLYSHLGTQVREVRGGEQYGVSNSHKLIFGLGHETTYDSLVIRWPDGVRESFNNLSIDASWTLNRGGCASKSIKLWPELKALCNDDSLELSLKGYNVLNWSTGSTADSISIHNTGLYYATILDNNDCPVKTTPVEIITDPDSIKPIITYEGNHLLCNGEAALLSLPFELGYAWSTGETTQTIQVSQSGNYYASVAGYCHTQNSDTVSINFLVPDAPETIGDTFSLGEQAKLTAIGDSIVWYYDLNGVTVIGTGPNFLLDGLTDNATVYAQNLKPIPGKQYQLGPVEQKGNTKYNAAFINGGLQFEVMDPIVLKEFTVYTDSAGSRIIEFTGTNFFFSKQVDLLPGTTVIQLDLPLPIGAYTVSTNNDLNNLVFGVNNPYLWRSSEAIVYPYTINGVVSINNSTFGEQFYYYFYDWKIQTSDKYCGSDIVPVTAYLDINLATGTIADDQSITITPNPTSGIIYLELKSGTIADLEVINLEGERIYTKHEAFTHGVAEIDLSGFPSGIYFVRMIKDGKMVTKKIVRL